VIIDVHIRSPPESLDEEEKKKIKKINEVAVKMVVVEVPWNVAR
jgi:hypothetical protein